MDEMKGSQPRVSAVMCTYNGEKFIGEQIDSIMNQSYPVYELIIQDDGSTDGTLGIINDYQKKYGNIYLFCNETPLGFNNNFTTAFYRAGGDYIASSDQDDIWRKDKIEILVSNMKDNALLFHNSCLFYSDTGEKAGMKNATDVPYNKLYLLLKPFVPGHECFFRREILPLYKMVADEENNISYDTLLMLAGSAYGKVEFVDEGLVYWRRHPSATSFHTSVRYGAVKGFLSALTAYKDSEKRHTMERFFIAVSRLDLHDASCKRIVYLLSKITFSNMISACFVCLSNRKSLYPGKPFVSSCIKSFFTPFYFLRDNTAFIIH